MMPICVCLTHEGVHQAADGPHGAVEDLGQLAEAGVQQHLLGDTPTLSSCSWNLGVVLTSTGLLRSTGLLWRQGEGEGR